MKKTGTIILIAVVLSAAGPVLARSGGYETIVRSWIQERDQAVTKVVYGWLRGAPAESQEELLTRIIELDVKLANENVPLYVTSFKEGSNVKACLRDLVSTYLKRQGVMYDTKTFFEGRSYQIIHSQTAAR